MKCRQDGPVTGSPQGAGRDDGGDDRRVDSQTGSGEGNDHRPLVPKEKSPILASEIDPSMRGGGAGINRFQFI